MAFWRAVFRRSARFTCGFSGAAGGSSFSRDVAHCGKRDYSARSDHLVRRSEHPVRA